MSPDLPYLVRYLRQSAKGRPRAKVVADIDDFPDKHRMGVILLMATYANARKKDPLELLKLFVICDALKIYPPADALSWLADAAETYLNSDGARKFEELLGLSAKRRGAAPPIKRAAEARRKETALLQMMRLIWREQITVAEAARRVGPKFGYKANSTTLQHAFPAFRRMLSSDREAYRKWERMAQEDAGVRLNRVR